MRSFERALGGRYGLVAVCVLGSFLTVAGVGTGLFETREVIASSVVANVALQRPDEVCGTCHRDIYDRYEKTSMARGSGTALSGAIEGGFRHERSDVTYRVFEREGALWMSYDRGTASGAASTAMHGEHQLLYYIGSGHRGRTYLYQVDGQWFELPINFYGRREIWDMAPNFEGTRVMPAPLPVDSNCLHCHATGVQMSLPEAKNRYAGAPFAQGGIGCSGCHGDATAHVAKAGHAPVLNPAKLAPAERDDVCLQCHLEGDTVAYRPGRSLAQYRPGDRLADDVVYFVRASAEMGGRRASSQYEAMMRSACRAGSGDRLTCTTCHDPHSSPAPAERVAFFRERCLSCHTSEKIAVEHHPEQKDCAVCHMPTRATSDISHEQLTDHNIQRVSPKPEMVAKLSSVGAVEVLKPVDAATVGDRALGLGYAQMAERGDRALGEKALELLGRAEKSGASDATLHAQLGYLSQLSGQRDRAVEEYTKALTLDAYEASALGNLAVLDASTGKVAEALGLLRRLVEADPSQTAAGLNLAYIECRVGEKERARGVLERLRVLNPDDPQLRSFLTTGIYAGQRCDLQ